jgi:multiple sugar transport system substrate-binding protein
MSEQFSRRTFLRVAGLGGLMVAASGLAACTPAPAPSAQPAAGDAGSAPAAATVRLRKMAWGSPLEKANIESGLATFMESHPNVEVEYIHTPDRYPEKLQTMLASGDAPDVYKVGNYYPDIAVKGALMDITDRVKNDPVLGAPDYFFPYEEERSSVNGKWYGIGSCLQWRLIFYNRPVLEAAGIEPPSTNPAETWTWDQFLEAANLLTIDAQGLHPSDAGYDTSNVQQFAFYAPDNMYNNFVFSNGGEIISSETLQYVLDTPEAIEAIQKFADLRVKDRVAAQTADLEAIGMNAWQMLQTGKVAMVVDGNWALQDIAQMNFDFGVGIMPKLKEPASYVASSWTGIWADTAYPDESWALFQYLNTDEYQAHLVRVGLWGVSHQTLLTEEGVKQWWNDDVHPDNWLAFETDYKFNYGKVIPNVVGTLRTEPMITQVLAEVWTGARTAEEVLVELNPQLNDTLAEEQAKV